WPRTTRPAWPVSGPRPPPIAATKSAPCSRAAATAARARATVGSPATGNTAAGRPRPASSSACRSGLAPVQISARGPHAASSAGSSAARPPPPPTPPPPPPLRARLPGPRADRPVSAAGREDRGELCRCPRLGHHVGHGVPPGRVVGLLLVRRRRGGVPVDLHQDHMVGVVVVLDHVEPQHTGL